MLTKHYVKYCVKNAEFKFHLLGTPDFIATNVFVPFICLRFFAHSSLRVCNFPMVGLVITSFRIYLLRVGNQSPGKDPLSIPYWSLLAFPNSSAKSRGFGRRIVPHFKPRASRIITTPNWSLKECHLPRPMLPVTSNLNILKGHQNVSLCWKVLISVEHNARWTRANIWKLSSGRNLHCKWFYFILIKRNERKWYIVHFNKIFFFSKY